MKRPRRLLENVWTLLPMLVVLYGQRVSTQNMQTSPPPQSLCRSRGKMLSVEAYRLETCALCYKYMPADQFATPKWQIVPKTDHLVDGFMVIWLTNQANTVSENGWSGSFCSAVVHVCHDKLGCLIMLCMANSEIGSSFHLRHLLVMIDLHVRPLMEKKSVAS